MANGADMKEMLDRIEAEIAGIKRQYDLFFQGIRRSEPSDKRREVEETVRRMGQRKIVNSNDQFRFHGLQSRFYSLSNLWVRMVRDLEEGRMKRDPSGALGRGASPRPDPVDPGHIEQVIAELVRPAGRAGCRGRKEGPLRNPGGASRPRRNRRKSGGQVEFRISVEEETEVKARLT
jgi:hypothetical protein